MTLIPLFRECCVECGEWSDFSLHVGSEIRNAKGDLLSVDVRCDNCHADHEITRSNDWRCM